MTTPTTVGLKKLQVLQIGLESTAGTIVPATHVWNGNGSFVFDDALTNPKYNIGVPASIQPEDSYVAETGVTVTLADCVLSLEQLVYLFAMGIVGTTASAGTTPFLMDNYALPTSTAINVIKTFSGEFGDGVQYYKCGYLFAEKINLHGDADANNGTLMMNAVLRGQKAVTMATITASLPIISSIEPLNINYGSIMIDALGTAAGTASPTTTLLRAVDINIVTGWITDRALSGRAAKDWNAAVWNGDPQVTGKFVVKATADAYTQVANQRSGTGIIVQLKFQGSGTRALKVNLPIAFTKVSELMKADRNGLHTLELDWEAGYSRTATAQGISFPVNMSASTTIT